MAPPRDGINSSIQHFPVKYSLVGGQIIGVPCDNRLAQEVLAGTNKIVT